MKRVLLILAVLYLLTACTKDDVETVNREDDHRVVIEIAETVTLTEFANAFMREWINKSPLNATFTYGNLEAEGLGDLMYELDDYTMEGVKENVAYLKVVQEKLETYPYKGLSEEEKKIYELMAFQLEAAIEGEAYTLYSNSFNPSFGLQVMVPLTLSQIEIETKKEAEAYLERVSKIPVLLRQALEVETLKAEGQLLLPFYLYEETIEQIKEMVSGEADGFMLYRSFEARIDEVNFLTQEEQEFYKEKCLALVTTDIIPAYKEMAAGLEKIKAYDTNTVGTSEWEDSEGYYEWLIYSHTSYDLSVIEMKRWLNRERSEVEKEIRAYTQNHPELNVSLQTMVEQEFKTIDDAYRAAMEVYEQHFMDYGVALAKEAVIPDYLEDHLPSGFYFPTSIDWQDYGTMYLQADSYTRLNIDQLTTLLHENIPGHHLYFSVLYNSDAPFVQKMSDWDAYSEGWSVYVQDYAFEAIGVDESVRDYLDLYMQYAYLSEMLRDMSIHVDGRSKDEIIDVLMDEGFAFDDAEKNYNRMLANPGEVYKYYYAYMKFKSYRERYEAAFGTDFDEKIFHDFILKNINMPFSTMDRLVKEALEVR